MDALLAGTIASAGSADLDFDFTRLVEDGADDANEVVSTGACNIGNTTYVFTTDRLMGLRFNRLPPEQGATILTATVQFTAAANATAVVHESTFWGQLIADAPAFTTGAANLSARTLTTASVIWNIPAWTSGDRTAAQLSADLSAIFQEIVDQATWEAYNSAVLLFARTNATGTRTWYTADQVSFLPAELHLTWEL